MWLMFAARRHGSALPLPGTCCRRLDSSSALLDRDHCIGLDLDERLRSDEATHLDQGARRKTTFFEEMCSYFVYRSDRLRIDAGEVDP